MAQFAIYWDALWRLQEMWPSCQGLWIPHIDYVSDQQVTGPQGPDKEAVEDGNIFACNERIGMATNAGMIILHWGQYYCNVQQSWKYTVQTEKSREKKHIILTDWLNI